MEKISDIKASARLRKQKSRARLASTEGINRIELTLTDRELASLDRGRVQRNPGREPYSRNEYIALLLLNDESELAAQQEATAPCRKCGTRPPDNCDRAFKGEAQCWLTYDCLELNLTSVTGHSKNKAEM
ncbi:hypothetical protein ACCY16_02035 [Candidatus Pantoea formicae]|uniref:hypothetical protein n=1 Tax=Candidatus Pantoea formicae TaxID=2608355 RepID=UPI003ED97EB6